MKGTHRMWRLGSVVLAALAAVGSPTMAAAEENRPFGDAFILAQVPAQPGFPEGIAVKGNRVYVAGAATFGTTGKGPSAVHAFDIKTGELAANDIAFDEVGNAYITDSMQATIWRVPAGPVPAGGKTPQIWFQDSRLASPYIGVNGLRLNPARTLAYITVTTDLLGQSFVYTLPLSAKPGAGDLKVFHQYGAESMPDGIAFGRSGLLYVAIATPGASGVSILNPAGQEVARLSNPPLSPIAPYDSPANIAFNGQGSILLSNHAFATGLLNPGQFAVVDAFVDDKESPLAKPVIP